jgi:hypothetical protein
MEKMRKVLLSMMLSLDGLFEDQPGTYIDMSGMMKWRSTMF